MSRIRGIYSCKRFVHVYERYVHVKIFAIRIWRIYPCINICNSAACIRILRSPILDSVVVVTLTRCQKKLSIKAFFCHLHNQDARSELSGSMRKVAKIWNPYLLPSSPLPGQEGNVSRIRTRTAAPQPFNKLSQICQNWVSPHWQPSHKERIRMEEQL